MYNRKIKCKILLALLAGMLFIGCLSEKELLLTTAELKITTAEECINVLKLLYDCNLEGAIKYVDQIINTGIYDAYTIIDKEDSCNQMALQFVRCAEEYKRQRKNTIPEDDTKSSIKDNKSIATNDLSSETKTTFFLPIPCQHKSIMVASNFMGVGTYLYCNRADLAIEYMERDIDVAIVVLGRIAQTSGPKKREVVLDCLQNIKIFREQHPRRIESSFDSKHSEASKMIALDANEILSNSL